MVVDVLTRTNLVSEGLDVAVLGGAEDLGRVLRLELRQALLRGHHGVVFVLGVAQRAPLLLALLHLTRSSATFSPWS